jgi:hypothetical protein
VVHGQTDQIAPKSRFVVATVMAFSLFLARFEESVFQHLPGVARKVTFRKA